MSKAERIVDDLIEDLMDRGGLNDMWMDIEPKDQEEIRATWIALVQKVLDA